MANFSIILLAAPMALTATAAPAAAEEEARTVVVRYDDLNLASASGRERLETRVKVAVRSVCGSRPHYRQTLSERAIALKCEEGAMRDADVKLAALFNGEGRLADKGGVVVAAP